jgi:transposase
MIPVGVQVFVCLEPIDLRAGFDRLAGLASERIGCDARSGALFVFFGKRRETVKILYFDGSGMCLFHKRLDRGTFLIPARTDEHLNHLEMDDAALQTLLDGLPLDLTDPIPTRSSRRRIH